MAERPKESRRGAYAGAACAVLVVAVVLLGFLVSVPTTSAVVVPYVATSAREVAATAKVAVPYTTAVPTVVGYANVTGIEIASVHYNTTTAQVLTLSRTSIYCNQSVYARNTLVAGANVAVIWNATGPVDVYVFNSTQFDHYLGRGAIASSTVNSTGAASGVMHFVAATTDSYFFLILNPPIAHSCVGRGTILVSSPGGPEVYSFPVTSYTTEFSTHTWASLSTVVQTGTETVTSTGTSTETLVVTATTTTIETCSPALWEWLFGQRAC